MRLTAARLGRRLTPLLLLASIAVAAYRAGDGVEGRGLPLALAAALTAGFVVQAAGHVRLAFRVRAILRARWLELVLTATALLLLGSWASVWARELAEPGRSRVLDPAYYQYEAAFLVVAALQLVAAGVSTRRILQGLELRPAQTVALGFAGAVLVGTLLLWMPASLQQVERVSLLDVLFTATSAVTVTGLTVYDPGTFHTGLGQVVLLALIQLGGIGTMAASMSLVVLAGRRLRLKQAAALQESMDVTALGQVRSQLRILFGVTAGAEAAGALGLWLLWRDRSDVPGSGFAALFHAVSAFCNAGFSTFATGLLPFRDDLATNAVMAMLIVVGGVGFPVLRSLGHALASLRGEARVPRLTLHARLALITTGVLLIGGAAATLLFEWHGVLAPLSWPSRLAAAGFLSVTARTAGFATVSTAGLAPVTLWLLMLLMFVGGSPGSTAGGIKTTTASTTVATLWATLTGRPRVEAFRRTIPEEQVGKALALVGVSVAVVAGGVMTLLATQAGDPLALTFEAVSAFGTVGLSMGLTPRLDAWGKVVLMLLMFVGRAGPLTLGFALAVRERRVRVTYPAEKIMIG